MISSIDAKNRRSISDSWIVWQILNLFQKHRGVGRISIRSYLYCINSSMLLHGRIMTMEHGHVMFVRAL